MSRLMSAPTVPATVLVVSLAGIHYATRPRKAARELSRFANVKYLALQSSGRGGRVDRAGRFNSDGIAVHQVKVRPRNPAATLGAKLENLFASYLPAFLRMAGIALKTPADIVYVAGPVLGTIALAHSIRFRSRIVLDVPERPGVLAAADSLASFFSRFEPFLIRRLASRRAVATVAVPSDVSLVRRWGFQSVIPLRNAPLAAWRAPYKPPRDSRPITYVVIGSVFPGRAYEIMIEALALSIRRGRPVALRIVGPGTDVYVSRLHELARELDVEDLISWEGAIEPDEVSATYLSAHVGLVLYEAADPGNDGLSNKILECVSTGRPVIAGDLPENRAFVTAHDVGWLTDVTPESLADTFERVAAEGDIDEFAARCRKLGDESLTWEADFAQVRVVLGIG